MRATIPSNMSRGVSGYKSPYLTKVVTLLIITSTSMRATIPSNMPRGISGYKSPNKSSYITNYNKYKHEGYNTQ